MSKPFARIHLRFSPEGETQFLVGEIRSGQAQSAALLAAIVGLFTIPGNERFISAALGRIPPVVIVIALVAYAFIGFVLLSGLRIAGVRVEYDRANDNGIHVSVQRLRMLTRRVYVTRTVLGVALFVTVFLSVFLWAIVPGLFHTIAADGALARK